MAARTALRACLGEQCRCSVVELCIDGARFAVTFDVDQQEHRRRSEAGLGAATDTGLLHALWELPEGIPTPAVALTDRDLSTLRHLGAGYVQGSATLTRLYVPAGVIGAVVVVAGTLGEAVASAARLPAIYRRLAVCHRRPIDAGSIEYGRRVGVGAVLVSGSAAEVVVAPREPVLGVPAVVRWWLAELAYRNGAYGNCAHCIS